MGTMKYIFFDLDNTLFPTVEFAERARKNAINSMIELGLDGNPEKMYSILIKLIKEKGPNYKFHFNDLCKKLKVKKYLIPKYVAGAVGAYHNTKYSISPFPSVPRILLNLKNNYKIYVASEGKPVKQWDKLIRLRISLLFDKVFITNKKKNIKFFRNMLKIIKAKPEECIMVGDKPDSDIEPAKKLKIKTIRIKTEKFRNKKSNADIEINYFYDIPKAIKKLEH